MTGSNILEEAKKLTSDEKLKLVFECASNTRLENREQIAYEILGMAAEEGNQNALIILAKSYLKGRGVKKSRQKYVEYLTKAMDLGNKFAKYLLGEFAIEHNGYLVDIETGVRYLTELSNEGDYSAIFTLAEAYHKGIGVDRNYEKAIAQYIKCLEVKKDFVDYFQAEACLGLVKCFVELHYIEEANAVRDARYYQSTQKNKEEAKKYLKMADKFINELPEPDRTSFINNFKIYEDILSDQALNLSKMTYGEFYKKYYGKHPRIFYPTKKFERLIYNDGIKLYFNKRDYTDEEKEIVVAERKELAKKRKCVIKRVVQKLKVSKNAEVVKPEFNEIYKKIYLENKDFEDNYLVDYSTCITYLDKYLEDILYYIFVTCLYENKKEKMLKAINAQEKEINSIIECLNDDQLKKFNNIITGISPNISEEKISNDKRRKLINDFVDALISGKNKNSTATKIENIKACHEAGKILNYDDTAEIKDIVLTARDLQFAKILLEFNDLVSDFNKLKKDDKFELGMLFDLTFISPKTEESEDGLGEVSYKNKLQDEIIDFVLSKDSKLKTKAREQSTILKLNELILKVEHFRVMIRNVASHRSILTQKSVETGINLCIMQKNSIFNLLDDLFGEFIEKQMVKQDIKGFLTENEYEYSEIELERLINKEVNNLTI